MDKNEIGRGSRPMSANSTTSSEGSGDFASLFKAFAKFGDSKSTGDGITLSNSDKWFRQAKVIEMGAKPSSITTVDTGIYFKKVAKTKKTLTAEEYDQFLEILAKSKNTPLESIKAKLTACGAPAANRATSAQVNATVARLTDHTKYTGSHKHRFDESGKGRGKAGRVDEKPVAGYVNGYKAQNTYDKKP